MTWKTLCRLPTDLTPAPVSNGVVRSASVPRSVRLEVSFGVYVAASPCLTPFLRGGHHRGVDVPRVPFFRIRIRKSWRQEKGGGFRVWSRGKWVG